MSSTSLDIDLTGLTLNEKAQAVDTESDDNEFDEFDELEDEPVEFLMQHNRLTLVWNNFYYFKHTENKSKSS